MISRKILFKRYDTDSSQKGILDINFSNVITMYLNDHLYLYVNHIVLILIDVKHSTQRRSSCAGQVIHRILCYSLHLTFHGVS